MKYNKNHFKFSLFIITFILVCIGYIGYNYKSRHTFNPVQPLSSKNLMVHFIDVGQGDAILIQTNNKNLLIDSGPDNKKAFSYLKAQGVKSLDYVIATHPHDDHIGSMAKIINTFDIHSFYAPKITNNTDAFKDMLNSLNNKNLKLIPAKVGLKINLGDNINCTILSPIENSYKELNNYSIVLKISYNNTSFIFMGDAEVSNENELIKTGYNLKADILKVGHHGSNSSTSKPLLSEVKPKVAIISCGQGNDYGHPNKETINKLSEENISIYRTDKHGSIILESDGNKIMKR